MTEPDNMVYGFEPDIFSIRVKAKTKPASKTIRKAAILKAIDCDNLQLDQMDGYFLWTYDTHPDLNGEERPQWAIYQTESTYAYRLSHMDFDKWVEIGKGFASDMKKMMGD